ncbi:hypothetical protein JYK02_06065 [Corallococcus macrosporus]|uniref:Uncharacterized protein n=1 Tax=Corallococcus macrosporus TaxID=35 RepID=A0ABS3D5Y0_9BACT|nr:hypothetical protein [Corallococcus macrosporus]MBN8227074.1 hypothetical protein [Corallococcus macrosporus]
MHRYIGWLLMLWLAFRPEVARGQGGPASRDPDSLNLLAPPGMAPEPAAPFAPTSVSATAKPSPDYRVGKHLALGTLMGSAGFLSGAVTGLVAGIALDRRCDALGCPGSAMSLVPVGLGAAIGTSLPIYFAGNMSGGQGSYGLTLLGATLGAVPSALLTLSEDSALRSVGVIGLVVTPFLGSFLGYGLSQDGDAPDAWPPSTPSLPGAQVTPMLGMSKKGAVVGGLMGQF